MSVSLREISVSSKPGHTFFLRVDWTEDLGEGFTVLLCDGVSAWDGKVSEGDIVRECEEMEMPMEKYLQDLQLALTEEGEQAEGYAFHLSPASASASAPARSGILHLSYEKVQKDISFRLGSVELGPVAEPSEVIKELISHGLGRSGQLQASNLHLQEENQHLREEQDHMTAEMERYVHGKEDLEKELYSRFALVLNEKKVKIRGLMEKIRLLEKDLGEKGRGPEPSHSPIEDSLTDIIDVAPCRKRRQRHLQDPGSEVKKAVQEVYKKESTEPTRSKAETKRKSAPIATTSKPTETDDLFDDF